MPPINVQSPAIIPCVEFLPDQAAYGNPGCTVARNVYPLTPSTYGPIPSLASVGYAALPSQVIGFYSFIDTTAAIHIFAGTATKLYRIKTGDASFIDVTKLAATYSATTASPWYATSFGNTVIFTNGFDVPQLFTIGTANFVNLGGTPPIGKYIATVRDFIFLANTTESATAFPQRVHWSAVGDSGSWPTLGTNAAAQVLSDAQDLDSSLGHIRGIASKLQSADVAIFMDNGVYAGSFIGSPAIFNFQIAQGAAGTRYSSSIVTHRGFSYYLSENGFMQFDGITARPIGAQKIDKWFRTDTADGVSPGLIGLTQGAADPTGKYIIWAYCASGSFGIPNRLLIYAWELDRWSVARVSTQWLGRSIGLGFSLEGLDAFGTVDSISLSFDDPFWQGGQPVLMAFDSSAVLSKLGGTNMAATIETQEIQPTPNHRSRINNSRPLIDGRTTPTVSLGVRNRLEDLTMYGTAVTMNIWGSCPQREDGRYIRGQINIAAGDTWTHVQGLEIEFNQSHRR